jgi:hypothetical protein
MFQEGAIASLAKMLLLCGQAEYTESRKRSMERHYELNSKAEPSEINTHIIDYSSLVDTVQLSTARLLDIPGALEAESFAKLIAPLSPENREHTIWEVGGHFDQSFISFVTASLIARRHHRVIILAEESEGINGGLPWEPKLEQHIQALKENGHLRTVELTVERYSTATVAEIETLTEQAQALAA